MECGAITGKEGSLMSQIVNIFATLTLLGSALIAGVFFAFSNFVMKALAAVPSSQGITAMQSINIVVINRSFLGTFFGTAVLSLVMAGLAVKGTGSAATFFFLGGALLYLAGTFLVTVLGNVPLNNQLAAVSPTDAASDDTWKHYLDRWTMWNHVRTAAAGLSALLYVVGLVQYGSI
jgi:uncharacterized membrane protein